MNDIKKLKSELDFLDEYTVENETRNAIENRKFLLRSILHPELLGSSRNKDPYKETSFYWAHSIVIYDLDYYSNPVHWSIIDTEPHIFKTRTREAVLITDNPDAPSKSELQNTVLHYYPDWVISIEINALNIVF